MYSPDDVAVTFGGKRIEPSKHATVCSHQDGPACDPCLLLMRASSPLPSRPAVGAARR